jgi:ribosomal protein S4
MLRLRNISSYPPYGQIRRVPLAPFGMALKKTRLDQLIVVRGLAESKTRAQALVMAGHVFVGDA